MDILTLKEVGKKFGNKKILENISLNVKKGEIIGIVGPSGSGKSVFIKMLIGFLSPSSGEISFNLNPKVGFSMQNNSIYDFLTTKQNIKYFAKLCGENRKQIRKFMPEILNSLGLKDFEKVLVRNLSGGTQKRVDIACSLANNPDILILDEPFVGLDPSLIENLSNFILELNKLEKTIIISSHRINELFSVCSRVFLVKNKTIKEVQKSSVKKEVFRW